MGAQDTRLVFEVGGAGVGVVLLLPIAEPSQQPDSLPVFESLPYQCRCLGHPSPGGEDLKHLVRDGQGSELACVLFGAAWKRPRQTPSLAGLES